MLDTYETVMKPHAQIAPCTKLALNKPDPSALYLLRNIACRTDSKLSPEN